MESNPPKLIAINHDDYHAKHIGVLPNGQQFFLTTPFARVLNDSPGCEYVALFLFNAQGDLLDAKIESLGARKDLEEEYARSVYNELLKSLGDVTYQRIEVASFSVEHDGMQVGLILREPEDEDDVWAVELLPGKCPAPLKLKIRFLWRCGMRWGGCVVKAGAS